MRTAENAAKYKGLIKIMSRFSRKKLLGGRSIYCAPFCERATSGTQREVRQHQQNQYESAAGTSSCLCRCGRCQSQRRRPTVSSAEGLKHLSMYWPVVGVRFHFVFFWRSRMSRNLSPQPACRDVSVPTRLLPFPLQLVLISPCAASPTSARDVAPW